MLVRPRVGAPDSPAAPDHEEEGAYEVVYHGESEDAFLEIARMGLDRPPMGK
jgi:hypothetical protein